MPVNLTAEDVTRLANWPLVIDALRAGHRLAPADIADSLVHARDNTMLVRSAWIDGLGAGTKAATVVPGNSTRSLPSVHAQISLFDDVTGQVTAGVDGTSVTAWKTAADSALGADLLARKDAKTLLMLGAGSMARPLIEAHRHVRPGIDHVLVWNRSRERAQVLADEIDAELVTDLDAAIPQADIICCATMTIDPVLKGALVPPGCHVDLVGAYRPDMREADDDLHHRAHWFVDSRATTLHHIGEFVRPLADGTINEDAIQGDLHDLVAGNAGRKTDAEITVFKNGGGAHLDLMVALALVKAYEAERA